VAAVLDPFIPVPDVRERHALAVHAPADFVADVARHFDMASLPLVRSAFWLRGRLMRARGLAARRPMDVASLLRMGWGLLAEEPGRFFAAGAVCQPWRGDVVFTPVEASRFASYAEPGVVKIAWTFETEPLGPTLTSLASETRAVATDAAARMDFLRYWRWARFGIVGIRRLLLPAIRRSAEQRWSAGR
jgi:hypothetical protein